MSASTKREKEYVRKYGITIADYDRMLEEQGGVCKLCGRPPAKRRLHVDHNHKTKRVRGLLCFRCNRWLTAWMTSTWLRRAAMYVEEDGK